MNSRLFRTTLSIVLLCMFIPALTIGLSSAMLTERSSAASFHNERSRQLELVRNACDLLLDECSFIYYQLLFDENTVHAMDWQELELPFAYGQLKSIQQLMRMMDLTANSRPFLHSILLYVENEHDLAVSSRYGLVRFALDPDRGWLPHYRAHADKRFFAQARTLDVGGQMLTVYMTFAGQLLGQQGVVVFHYALSEMRALLPRDATHWIVLDEEGQTLFASGGEEHMAEALRAEILAMAPGTSLYPQSQHDAVVYQVQSDAYGWRFINIAGRAMLRDTARDINRNLAIIITAALVAGVLAAVMLSRNAVRPVKRILDMIQRMSETDSLPTPATPPDDEYEAISYKLLRNNLEHQKLREELGERQLRLREAEMLALQAQINPHFLYNTMEIINWRAIGALGDTNSISHMITTLSALLRYALERPEELVPFQREIDHARQYAELMSYRLGAIFSVRWEVSARVRDIRVPKLIVQPLIENAIQHGIQLKEGGGTVTVDAVIRAGLFHLTVADDGAGMKPSLLESLRHQLQSFNGLQYAHIGLFNVYQRVRLATDDKAQMTIDSAQDEGTRIHLVFPIPEGGTPHGDDP